MPFDAAKLMDLRKLKGWTQDEAVEATGIPLGTYRDIEQARTKDPSLDIVKTLATVFGVTIEELINGGHTPQKPGRPKGKHK